jgi:hypothetical protein
MRISVFGRLGRMTVMIVLRSFRRGQLIVVRATMNPNCIRAAAGNQQQYAESGNHAAEEARWLHHIKQNNSQFGHCLPLTRRTIACRAE